MRHDLRHCTINGQEWDIFLCVLCENFASLAVKRRIEPQRTQKAISSRLQQTTYSNGALLSSAEVVREWTKTMRWDGVVRLFVG